MDKAERISVLRTGADMQIENGIETLVAFFASIACEEGWQPGSELNAYQDRSTYFALTDAKGLVRGGLQLIAPCMSGTLPCLKVWPELTEVIVKNRDIIAHVALLAVAKEWRGKRRASDSTPFWRLTSAMWNHCVKIGIQELWIEATPATLRAYRLVGWPLQVRGELREHWGEPCFPCSLSIRQVAGALAERAVKSRVYRRVLSDMLDDSSTASLTIR